MTPHFHQDNISYHDCAEEGYHLWGTSWMMQFGNVPTGGYFWRPAYINHGSFASEYGCIALGRTDSKLFNHFHYNPWSTPVQNAGGNVGPDDCSGSFSFHVSQAFLATENLVWGDTVYTQYWYRDPAGGPCSSGFNLSNGLEIAWSH